MKKHMLVCALISVAISFGQESPETLQADSLVAGAPFEAGAGPEDMPVAGWEADAPSGLEDLEEAAKFDSLWLKELSQAAGWYQELQEAMAQAMDSVTVPGTSTPDTEVLKQRLALLNEKTPFNISYNPSLERVIHSFSTGKRGLMERMLTASQFYFPMFEEALDKYNLPLEIKYLAIVESALNPRARSRVGATGLWQFMFSTGRMYNLEVSSYVDERSDPLRATEAACRYLSKLYEIFGDWDLALAAYNSGPGNVNKAIRRSGGYTNYWNLRPFLPRETAGYVPAFYATMYLFEYAKEHGLTYQAAHRPYFETDTVWVKETLTFDQISRFTGVSQEELKTLNPAYKLDIIPKATGKPYTLRLPVRAMGRFVTHEDSIYTWAQREIASREQPLPQLVKAEDRIRYRVRSGDYLGKIAQRYGVGVSQIRRWNGLRSDNLRIGQRLTIYPRRPVAEPKAAAPSANSQASSADRPKVHIVEKGESLWIISQKYPGVSIENLREWNGISGNNLQPGTRIKLCNCSS